jgi:hypothetical protein
LSGSGNFNVLTIAGINQSQGETTFSGVFTGNGSIVMSLQHPLNLTGNSSAYLGQMIVNQGNLNLSGAGNFNSDMPLTVNPGATLNIATTSAVSIGSLNGSGVINLSSGGLIVNQTQANAFSGVFKGSSNLILSGGSTLTLTGNSSQYAGLVTVSSSALVMSGSGNFNGNVAVNVGASGDVSVRRARLPPSVIVGLW